MARFCILSPVQISSSMLHSFIVGLLSFFPIILPSIFSVATLLTRLRSVIQYFLPPIPQRACVRPWICEAVLRFFIREKQKPIVKNIPCFFHFDSIFSSLFSCPFLFRKILSLYLFKKFLVENRNSTKSLLLKSLVLKSLLLKSCDRPSVA